MKPPKEMVQGYRQKLKNPARRVIVGRSGEHWFIQFKRLDGRRVISTKIKVRDDAMIALVSMALKHGFADKDFHLPMEGS